MKPQRTNQRPSIPPELPTFSSIANTEYPLRRKLLPVKRRSSPDPNLTVLLKEKMILIVLLFCVGAVFALFNFVAGGSRSFPEDFLLTKWTLFCHSIHLNLKIVHI
ncbi:hypothetical protein CSKR_106829 [Clonorchis sinensis]|uniref:Uncharacterized protein n=1 Tax=Clonorchis sinensis TaxID=79923 RepID=A0A419PUP3_CLOSI|nr:hypothetical protein CSKR_106829 [Clonorchis sinensis]